MYLKSNCNRIRYMIEIPLGQNFNIHKIDILFQLILQYLKQDPRIRKFCNLECVQQNDPYFISAISAFNPTSATLKLKSNFYCLVIFHYLFTLLQKQRLQDYTYSIVCLTAIKTNLPKKCKYCYSQVRRFATDHKCSLI